MSLPAPPPSVTAYETMLGSKQPAIRRQACRKLGDRPGIEAVAVLAKHLEREQDEQVRRDGVIALRRAGLGAAQRSANQHLLAHFQREQDAVARIGLLQGYELYPGDRALDLKALAALAKVASSKAERATIERVLKSLQPAKQAGSSPSSQAASSVSSPQKKS